MSKSSFSSFLGFSSHHNPPILISEFLLSHKQTCKHKSHSSLVFEDIVLITTSVMAPLVTVLSSPAVSSKPHVSHVPLSAGSLYEVPEPQHKKEEATSHS